MGGSENLEYINQYFGTTAIAMSKQEATTSNQSGNPDKETASSSATTNTNTKNNNNTAITLSTPTRKGGDTASSNSCLSGPANPKTTRRTKDGKIQVVHFDERVVVHTVPHWDPSRTQSFSDMSNSTNETTCNCCVVV